MFWKDPDLFVITTPTALNWSVWWRSLSIITVLILILTGFSWSVAQNLQTVFYGLILVACVFTLFGLLAGWWLFRYGMALERVERLKNENHQIEQRISRWANQSINLIDFSFIFPPSVPRSLVQPFDVNSNNPLRLSQIESYQQLFEDLITPLRQTLLKRPSNKPLRVYLPQIDQQAAWQQFIGVWQVIGLPIQQLSQPITLLDDYAEQLNQWLTEQTLEDTLVILWQINLLDPSPACTEGAAAWLLSATCHSDTPNPLCLYRPMPTTTENHHVDIAKFIRYQSAPIELKTLWYNQPDSVIADTLLTAYSQPYQIVTSSGVSIHPAVTLEQQFLTHWLGAATRFTDWFTATLAMNNALQQKKSQLMLITQDSRALIATISPVYIK